MDGYNEARHRQLWRECYVRANTLRQRLLCLRPHGTVALSDAFVWRLSVWRLSRTSSLTRKQRGLGRLKLAQSHTWLRHQFQGQKVKGQLVADVLNSQHAGIGATWRINTKIMSTFSGRRHIVAAARLQLVNYRLPVIRCWITRKLNWPEGRRMTAITSAV